MRKLLVLGFAIFLLGACKKEADLDLNFKAVFDDQPLELNEAYALGDLDLKFEKLTFYLTDVAIVNEDNEKFELWEALFVDLNGDPTEGFTASYKNLPEGKYTKLTFNIGVTEDLNAKTPNDYNVTDVLGKSDHYWEAWGSYIFSKTEGRADASGDGVYDLKWFYHTGSDALNRPFELNQDIVLDEDAPRTMEFVLDYNRLLRYNDGTPFDIEAMPQNHNPNKLEVITQLVDNYVEALKLKI